MIWATRGRNWGFRFLRDGGFADPLPEYEKAFAGFSSETVFWSERPEFTVLRFTDPEQRKDSAGRLISHDFVLYEPEANLFDSFEIAKRTIWAEVSREYSTLWEQDS